MATTPHGDVTPVPPAEVLQVLSSLMTQYPRLFDSATDVAFVTDDVGRLTWTSPAVEQVLGWTTDQALGRNLAEFLHPEDSHKAQEFADLSTSDAPGQTEVGGQASPIRVAKADGTFAWCTVSAARSSRPDGRFAGIVGGIQDVDALVSSRDRDDEAHARLRRVINAQVDPHVLFRAVRDDDGVIVDFLYEDANDAAADFEHRSRDQLVGATLREVTPSPEEAELDIADCAAVLESGTPGVWNDKPTVSYVDDRGHRVIVDIRIVRIDDERVSYSWRDVTDRTEVKQRVARSEERFRLLAETMSDVVSLIRDGVLAWVSPSVTTSFGWLPEDLVGTDPMALVHPDDADAVAAWRPGEGSDLQRRRYRLRRQDGGYHWVDSEGRVIPALSGMTEELMLSSRIVDAEVEALSALESRARHDSLTGLVNRVEMFDQVDRMLTGQARTGDRLAMVFCDLDGFKAVNDSYGHNAGDLLLREIAVRLQAAVRAGDVVGRLGGDELVVVLNGVRDLDDAIRIADKLRARIGEDVEVPGGTVAVSASVGVTLAEPGESVDTIVARADSAMYEAKRRGKDAVFAIRGAGA